MCHIVIFIQTHMHAIMCTTVFNQISNLRQFNGLLKGVVAVQTSLSFVHAWSEAIAPVLGLIKCATSQVRADQANGPLQSTSSNFAEPVVAVNQGYFHTYMSRCERQTLVTCKGDGWVTLSVAFLSSVVAFSLQQLNTVKFEKSVGMSTVDDLRHQRLYHLETHLVCCFII